jgi:hypothetical protein
MLFPSTKLLSGSNISPISPVFSLCDAHDGDRCARAFGVLRSASVIDLYYWPTPNGQKIALFFHVPRNPKTNQFQ